VGNAMNDLESKMMGDPSKIFFDINANKIHFEPMVDDESYRNEARNTEGGISRWYEGKISWEGRTGPEPYEIGAFKEVGDALRDILLYIVNDQRVLTWIRVTRLTSFIDSQVSQDGVISVNYLETVLMDCSQPMDYSCTR
jgi:hypothetical protein